MAVNWTEEQLQVIGARGQDVLVSAAAGSGKTAVLVERVLSRVTDTEHPVDIDRMLIVTFTNAAAAEMRERIRDRLLQKLEEHPDDAHLQRQSILVQRASIMTIHSFCLQVLRSHFHLIGLDPAFRVADEGELRLMEHDAAERLLRQEYEKALPEFLTLVESLSSGTQDEVLIDLLLQICHTAEGHPWPLEWLEACAAGEGEERWLQAIVDDVRLQLEGLAEILADARRIALEPGGPSVYLDALQADEELLESLSGRTYEEMAHAFRNRPGFARLGSVRGKQVEAKKKEQVQELRGGFKDGIAHLEKKYFNDAPEVLHSEYEKSTVLIRELVRLAGDFMKLLDAEKTRKNVLDFSDLEHLALRILLRDTGEGRKPGEAALEYARQYEEIYTDEYQDSNLVQELILDAVSGGGKGLHNRFMVGDVKQSIYRFRLARPELFLEKYRSYGTEPGRSTRRLDLHRNFRSRSQVLHMVNGVFGALMREPVGGITYDRDAALYPGAAFAALPRQEDSLPEEELLAQELHLISPGDSEDAVAVEARMVGERIRELVGRFPVWDRALGAYRPAKYRDMVILMRSASGRAEMIRETLTDMGIPCFADSRTGYFSAREVRVVLSALQILDNPMQDIPLAAVLKSPLCGISDELLARVRICYPEGPFWEACRACAPLEGFAQLQRFYEWYEALRQKVSYTPVHELIWEILDSTGYHTYVLAQPAGDVRRANLEMLMQKAADYEKTSYRGLHHFLRYMEGLKTYEVDYGEAAVIGEQDDTVRLMTIHKSKGLEFPVVFVFGLQKRFNEMDTRGKVVIHPDLGIACDYVDPDRRLRSPSLKKRVIAEQIRRDNLGEELRILYVAMTRAKEKLILTAAVTEEEMEELGTLEKDHIIQPEEKPFDSETMEVQHVFRLLKAHSALDWLTPIVWSGVPCLKVFLHNGTAGTPELPAAGSSDRGTADLPALDEAAVPCRETAAEFERIFAAEYRWKEASRIRGKLSVSELKKRAMAEEDEEGVKLYEEAPVIPLVPAFEQEEIPLSGAARGTAYHAVMQNLRLLPGLAEPDIQNQLEDLVNCGKITREECRVIDPDKIRRFLDSELGGAFAEAWEKERLYREQPFVMGVAARSIDPSWPEGETVLVQGIIDAFYYQEDGTIVLVDYKTDIVPDADTLARRYQAQLDYYAQALEKLTGHRVARQVLYSFHLNKIIELQIKEHT